MRPSYPLATTLLAAALSLGALTIAVVNKATSAADRRTARARAGCPEGGAWQYAGAAIQKVRGVPLRNHAVHLTLAPSSVNPIRVPLRTRASGRS